MNIFQDLISFIICSEYSKYFEVNYTSSRRGSVLFEFTELVITVMVIIFKICDEFILELKSGA